MLSRYRLSVGLVAGLITLVVATPASAQRRGGFFGRGGFLGAELVVLLSIDDVAKKASLTEEQSKQVKEALETYLKKRGELFGEMQGAGGDEDRQEIFADMTKNREEADEKVRGIVKGDALKRVEQIQTQLTGLGSLGFPGSELAEQLSISDDQREEIGQKMMEAAQGIFEQFRDAFGDTDKTVELWNELLPKQREAVMSVLTDEQKTKWKEITGEQLSEDEAKSLVKAIVTTNAPRQ